MFFVVGFGMIQCILIYCRLVCLIVLGLPGLFRVFSFFNPK